jgi:hypothetical protein
MQLPPAAPDDPVLQRQAAEAELPAGALEFDGQALHVEFAEAPTAVEYVPAGQAVHDASAVCPVATPYFPAPQTRQVSVTVDVVRNLPAAHGVHGTAGVASGSP